MTEIERNMRENEKEREKEREGDLEGDRDLFPKTDLHKNYVVIYIPRM